MTFLTLFQMIGNAFPGMLSLGEAIRAQNKKSGPLKGSDQVTLMP